MCELRSAKPDSADRLQEHVGGAGEQQAELIGPPALATGAVGKKSALLFLDAIFHLPTGAGDLVVNRLGVAFQARDDKARIGSLDTVFGFGNDPPRAISCAGRVVQSAEEPMRFMRAFKLVGHCLHLLVGQGEQAPRPSAGRRGFPTGTTWDWRPVPRRALPRSATPSRREACGGR